MPFRQHHILLAAICLLWSAQADAQTPEIAISRAASASETLAAQELSRTIYLRTGFFPKTARTERVLAAQSIVVARKDRVLAARSVSRAEIAALKPQNYLLKTLVDSRGAKTHCIIGGDDAGVLYGAYRFIEKLGVRFYLHGDVVPDELGRCRTPIHKASYKARVTCRWV